MTRSRQTADWGSRAGLAKIIPSSVAVGSGTGSADSTGKVTFSGATSVSLNGVFTSAYRNYKIQINVDSNSAAGAIKARLRASGTDNSSFNYNYSYRYSESNLTTWVGGNTSSDIQFNLGYSDVLLGYYANCDIFDPQTANYTGFIVDSTSKRSAVSVVNYQMRNAGAMTVTTAYDGITVFHDAGNITGTVTVYGYN